MTTEEKLGSYLPSGNVTTAKKDKERVFSSCKLNYCSRWWQKKITIQSQTICVPVYSDDYMLFATCFLLQKTKGVITKEANKMKLCYYKSRLLSADLTFHHVSAPHPAHVTCKISFFLNMPAVVIAPGRKPESCTKN